MPDEKSQDQESYISDLVRAGDKDRYLATLLAPAHLREHLFALHCFDLEIQAISDRVVEPLAGEIRIQWWRDWLLEYRRKGQSGNPVADSLHMAIETCGLPTGLLLEMLDGWISVIQREVVSDCRTMEDRLIATERPILSLLAQVFGIEPDSLTDLSNPAVYAGYLRLLKNIGTNRACVRDFIWDDLLLPGDENLDPEEMSQKLVSEIAKLALKHQSGTRADFAKMPKKMRPAFAHLAVIGPELSKTGSNDAWFLKITGSINPIKRQWRIWRAVSTGRL